MAIEIERKFLLASDDWRGAVVRSQRLRQGYLVPPGGTASVRVRIAGERAELNIKAAVLGRSRTEYEYPIPLADAEQMLDGLCVGRVDKTRHLVECAGWHWEIDEFEGDNAGLVVAEIELPSADAAFPRPHWLGEEVTEQARYYNHALAQTPYRHWS